MKVLYAAQVRKADQYTIDNEPIASIDLMERACRAFVTEFVKRFDATYPVYVFCGIGNNGGDGLGIARLLLQEGYSVKVFVAGDKEKGSADFSKNYQRLKQLGVTDGTWDNLPLPSDAVIVDALFGTGLSRPVEGKLAVLISELNALPAIRVAVDVPSGLFCDKPQGTAPAIQAHLTISFQTPKLAFFMPENYRWLGEWKIVDIGLSTDFISSLNTPYHYQLAGEPGLKLPHRAKFMHKGDAGRVLIIGGSKGKVGAIILTARACLRTGAGLVTVHAPGCATLPLHASLPESMIEVDEGEDIVTSVPTTQLDKYSAIALGPGLGTDEKTAATFRQLLPSLARPAVLDADALNILSEHPDWLNLVPANSIITPHPIEFKRLAGGWSNDYERLEKQIEFAKAHTLITIVKGAHTTICTPAGEVYFNSTGNPGMAKGGSGDVLTGIIAAFLAQGFSAERSARMGVFFHGLAGDIAKETKGEYGIIASDIIESLPPALAQAVSKKMF